LLIAGKEVARLTYSARFICIDLCDNQSINQSINHSINQSINLFAKYDNTASIMNSGGRQCWVKSFLKRFEIKNQNHGLKSDLKSNSKSPLPKRFQIKIIFQTISNQNHFQNRYLIQSRPLLGSHFILRHIVVCTCLLSTFNINSFSNALSLSLFQREVAMSSAVRCTHFL